MTNILASIGQGLLQGVASESPVLSGVFQGLNLIDTPQEAAQKKATQAKTLLDQQYPPLMLPANQLDPAQLTAFSDVGQQIEAAKSRLAQAQATGDKEGYTAAYQALDIAMRQRNQLMSQNVTFRQGVKTDLATKVEKNVTNPTEQIRQAYGGLKGARLMILPARLPGCTHL